MDNKNHNNDKEIVRFPVKKIIDIGNNSKGVTIPKIFFDNGQLDPEKKYWCYLEECEEDKKHG